MKCAITFAVCLSLVATVSSVASADGDQAWRCSSTDPNQFECPDVILNIIEDIIVRDWPTVYDIAMPPIPYSCKKLLGGAGSHSGMIPWKVRLSGSVLSFLIGRHTASSAMTMLSAEAIGLDVPRDAGVSYVFDEGNSVVLASGGTTGVTDLGAVLGVTPSGSFWTSQFRLWVDSQDVGEICQAGYPGHRVGSGDFYSMDWTPAQATVAEVIRNQFRRATRIAVLGSVQDDEIIGLAGKCVDVTGGFLTEGTPIELWTCAGSANQHWTVFDDGTIHSLGHCLDVYGGSTVPGTLVDLAACNGTPAQQWTITPAHQLINPHSGQCLDAPGFNSADGTQLQIWPCNGGANQAWWLTE